MENKSLRYQIRIKYVGGMMIALLKSKISMFLNLLRSLLGGFIFVAVRDILRLIESKEYRYLSFCKLRYAFVERYQEIKITACERRLSIPDMASFLSMYEEIYCNKIYQVPFEPKKVLDLGANIGLSILWLKQHYPAAEIIGYEADKNIFKQLQLNVTELDGVLVHNEAVWHEDTVLSFSAEGADGGRIDCLTENEGNSRVKARDIRNILQNDGPFNFIKMDVEGAESTVIPACRGLLDDTDFIFCEYHSVDGKAQNLDEILNVLREEGFRIHIQPVATSQQPFMKRKHQAGFDMQLNIFGWTHDVK
jgi:FkbM family methyltransferase